MPYNFNMLMRRLYYARYIYYYVGPNEYIHVGTNTVNN